MGCKCGWKWLAGDKNGGPRAERFPAGWISFHHNSPSYSTIPSLAGKKDSRFGNASVLPRDDNHQYVVPTPPNANTLGRVKDSKAIHSTKLFSSMSQRGKTRLRTSKYNWDVCRALVRRIQAQVTKSWSFRFGRSCRYLKFRALVTNHKAT